jgi:short-subunit dehydrogenase
MEYTVKEYGQIDVLINNAGRTMWTPFEDIEDLSIFKQIMDLNYLGCVHCTDYALPYLKKTKGQIVGVSSVAGLNGVPSRTAYSASKHAMFGFFDSLRIELKGTEVSITMIAPDFVVSEMHKRALDGSGNPLGESPLQESKVMTAEECAHLIIRAVQNRDRLLITSLRGKLGRWMKLIAPSIVDKIAAKAITDAK